MARIHHSPTRSRSRLLCTAWVLAMVALIAGCTSSPDPSPTLTPPVAANSVATQLATALSKGDLSGLPVTDPGLSAAQDDYAAIMAGMDGLLPAVEVGGIAYPSSSTATVTLKHAWSLGPKTWTYTSTASLSLVRAEWQVQWAPPVVHPDLTSTTRMRHTRQLPTRAPITGVGDEALVQEGEVFKLGIDKQNLDKSEWESSARILAGLVGVDEDAYVKAVLAAGDQAFVVAIVMRPQDIPEATKDIAGFASVKTTAMLPVNPTFARSILGVMAPATPEQLAAAKGGLYEGDLVGASGLQQRYQDQLAGVPGQIIYQVARRAASGSSPSGSASPSSASAEPSAPGSSSPAWVDVALFAFDPVPGQAVATTMSVDQQLKAEKVLAGVKGIASMVVLDPKTGAVLVAANSPAAQANPYATVGRYPPGSTFKVVSSLALLRAGFTPSSQVNCTADITINGKKFTNYSDFPASKVGTITLTDALANSCNTAFIAQAPKLSPQALAEAAGSLGLGIDYDSGFSSFYGSVPPSSDPVVRGANMIGQGQIEASPMAMAGVAASVAAGETRVPYLVAANRPAPTGTPLTAAEAASLRAMMTAVVTSGSGRSLSGVVTGAKTGTAEFGTNPVKTHAWMIAWNGDLAIAVMVNEGESGSASAAPLIKAFLT